MNGIDAIYDPSDVRRMLAQLREQRLQMEDARKRKTTGTTKAATTAWDMWNKEQSTRTKELVASKDYVMDPEYMKKGFFSRSLTPSGGRVIPSDTVGKDFTDIRGPKTIPESVGKTTEAIKETSEKSFGSTLGKIGAGIGVGLSAYDRATNWKKKSDVDKGLGLAKTGLGIASMFNPAFGIAALGTSILDQFWD
jgi:hypothetical protein